MRVDTPWSDPGSTFGIPDRYQSRTYRGLFLSAGDNRRKPGGKVYIRPSSETPWHVYDQLPHPDLPPGAGFRTTEVAGGVAGSQEEARACAEVAARKYLSKPK